MKVLITGGSGFIGTNLTLFLKNRSIPFLNLDLKPPKISSMQNEWVLCDIMDISQLERIFTDYQPSAVIHLAAETDTNPSWDLRNYEVNTVGTENLVQCILKTPSIERSIFTSTQFVNQRPGGPAHDEDFAPHTVYGESKIHNEKLIRRTQFASAWTIIRPTNIWGPWHLRYPFEFWKILAEGKYFHPGWRPVMRSYGYVGNVITQMMRILESPREQIDHKVFYVGDRPINLYNWVNGFSLAQTGRKVRVLPRFFVYLLAVIGDILRILNVKFPITTARFSSMTTSNPVNMERTFDVFGEPPYSLEQGIAETIDWMKLIHPDLVRT